MKMYFAGSIRAGREDADIYNELVTHLKKYGKVLTEAVGDKTLPISGEDGMTDQQIHDRDLKWILECDAMIAEISAVSHGVGYEIGRAVEHKKPILCLYKKKEGKLISAMINGCPSLVIIDYQSIEQAKSAIDKFFNRLITQ